ALSTISKPMMAIFSYPLWIFFARTLDRFGKGIRTGARDAILSDEGRVETKGKIFGFHRSMDTLGAVIGPLFALAYLYFYPEEYKYLFYIAFVPGVFSILASFLLKEKKQPFTASNSNSKTSIFSFLQYLKESPKEYKKLIFGLLIFTLFNSSDLFLLLKVKEAGFSDSEVIGVYVFYNFIYALFAFPIGILADKIGLKTIFISGLFLFAIVYFGMASNKNLILYIFLFLLYGVYSAATEGVSKAWITNITDKKDTATAIGVFAGFQSICTMLASTITGFIWFQFGANFAFISTAVVTILVALYFLWVDVSEKNILPLDEI
ncbi:MAG: MFS transporter, partial [Leptospiraceae bacterium]|nr:MFS transporter [Leptospiraceae bacterium]